MDQRCEAVLSAAAEARDEDLDEAPVPVQVPGFIAHDPALLPTLALLRRAAPSEIPVLLFGESGTGKEVAAHALHALSPRAKGPFVPVNCGSIAENLAESELFGHERGSFTGAVGASVGAFGAADSGTLFLDEIGELPLSLQAKLLRALESHEVKAVGATRPRTVDVRIVCASHRDLRSMADEGTFRADLYWRLRGAVIPLPPLRARPLDVLPLAEAFLRESAPGRVPLLAPDAREALLAHRWPGNVRELRQVVKLAALLCDGPLIHARDLHLDDPQPKALSTGAWSGHRARAQTLAEVEADAIRACHARTQGLRRVMAEELGIARSSLLRKLDKLGLR